MQTVFLQCGDVEQNQELGKDKRFYTSAEAWRKANPPPEVEKRRFQDGLGAASIGSSTPSWLNSSFASSSSVA